MRKIYFFLAMLFVASGACGQVYLNTFTGASLCPTNGNTPAMAANSTGTALSRSTITCTPTANVFNSTTLNNTAAIINTSYIEFSATANAGFQLNLTSLSFLRQGSNTAPNQLEVRYSTDNFATSTTWGAAALTPTAGAVLTWDFADFATSNGGTVTFRFYPYGTQRCDLTATAAASTGTFRLDDVTLNGSVTAAGGASLTGTTLTSFSNVCINTTAGPNSFTINGSGLSTADVTVASLSGFTFSTTSGGTYFPSLTLTQPGGTYAQDIYVKFSPIAVQSYNGNIVIGGGGASDYNEAATGAGVDTKPSVKAGTVSNITGTGATISDTITAIGCSAVTAYGIEYSLTNGFADGAGTPVAGSNLSGGIYSVDVTLLSPATTYYYKAYATNNGGTSYSTQRSFVTLTPEPTNHVTSFACGTTTSSSIALTWVDATGGTVPVSYLIKWSSVDFGSITNPVDGTPEPSGSGTLNIAQGVQVANITSLSASTTYYFKIFPYTNSGSIIDYKTDGTVPQTSCTTLAPPILAWQFGSPQSAGDEVTYNATTNNSNLATAVLSRGAGITATALQRGFSANNFSITATTESDAITANEYYQFNVAANSGYAVSLSSIVARMRRSGATAPNAYIWMYSLDGTNFTDIGSSVSFTTTGDGDDQPEINLTGVSALQGVASGTTITFRLYAWGGTSATATLALGRYGTGVTTNSLSINGSVTVSSTPNIVASTASLPAFTSTTGVPSAEQQYTVSGTNLTNDITVMPPVGFEVSTTSGSGFVTNPAFLTLPQSGGTVTTTTIFVRMNSATLGTNSGSIANVSTGATTRNVAVTGKVLAAQPSTQSAITFGTITGSSIVVNFSGGNGAKRIVLAKAVTAVNSDPADGTTYADNPGFTSGAQIGTGNYVVYAGTANTVTVTGLNAGATYHFAVYEYNDGNTVGAENYLVASPGINNATTTASSVTYTWVGGNSSWATAANWSPARSSTATTDILQFSTGTAVTVTDVPAETVGQLLIAAGTQVALSSTAAVTLTIGGQAGTDLSVQDGSSLTVSGASALTITLSTGATGSITNSSSITLAGAAHRLIAADANGIIFGNTCSFTAGTAFAGNPFGGTGTTANSVIFASGSAFIQQAGSNPFALTQPASVVVFQTGSLFKLAANLTPSLSGRTYSNFELDAATTITATAAAKFSVDNLSITTGTLNLALTGTPGHAIKGNINVATGATLNFNPISTGTVNLNGAGAQTITNAGTFTIGVNETFNLDNPSGLSLSSDIAFSALVLTNGKISLGASNLTATSISGGSSARYIITNGSGKVTINNIGAGPVVFPVGPDNFKYNPATIENGSGHNWSVRVADTITADAGFNTNKAVLLSWIISPSVNPPAAGADITFQFDEATQVGGSFSTATNVQAWHRPNGSWVRSGTPVAVNTTLPNAATVKVTGLTGFSQYGLSNIDGALPVNFGNVKATQLSNSIKVEWSNLTELDVINYSVERSADGRNFTTIGTVNARWNNGGRADYSFTDISPLAGINYYRIRSTETDSRIKYSIIVKVDIRAGATQLVLYPNPATDGQLSYQAVNLAKGQYTIRVFNAVGQQVYSRSLNHSGGSVTEAIVLPAVKAGVYSLQLTSVDLNLVKTFVIQ